MTTVRIDEQDDVTTQPSINNLAKAKLRRTAVRASLALTVISSIAFIWSEAGLGGMGLFIGGGILSAGVIGLARFAL